jgi:hypothetical protein
LVQDVFEPSGIGVAGTGKKTKRICAAKAIIGGYDGTLMAKIVYALFESNCMTLTPVLPRLSKQSVHLNLQHWFVPGPCF